MFLLVPTAHTASTGPKRKSLRRRQKEGAWWALQKEKEQLAVERERAKAEKVKKSQCKYYLNGYCKNVSRIALALTFDPGGRSKRGQGEGGGGGRLKGGTGESDTLERKRLTLV